MFRTGKRLYLRPIQEGDLPDLERWINDPEVTQFLEASYPMTMADEQAWFEGLSKRKESDVVLGIVLKEGDRFIGNMGIHRINHRHGFATTGSIIGAKEHWGKGYGTEAKMILLEYAFNTLNLRKICSLVYDYNPRSKKCLEKCGYRVEGVQKAQIFRNGRYADVYQLAVFRDQWLPLWAEYKEKFLDQQ